MRTGFRIRDERMLNEGRDLRARQPKDIHLGGRAIDCVLEDDNDLCFSSLFPLLLLCFSL